MSSRAQLVSALVPASLGARQVLRLRRLGLAARTYLLTAVLVVVAGFFGVLPRNAALEVIAAYVAINLGLYLAIRSGFNLRFKDASLTTVQIVIAISVVMYLVYHMSTARDIALSGCFVVFLFGTFRLDAGQFRFITLYTLAAYALVLNLLMHLRPDAIVDVHHDWMSWLLLAGLLPCFAIVGEQVNRLRRRLRANELLARGRAQMSTDFYWDSGPDHRLTHRSAADGSATSKASAFARGVALGERRWDVPAMSPDEAGWRAHRQAMEAHVPFRDFEHSRLGVDGTERFLSISGDPVFDSAGVFKGYHGVGSDITLRRRSEQALREGAQELRLFAENIPAMTASWDESLKCRFANRLFMDFFGLTDTVIIGKRMRDILGEEVHRETEGHFAQVLAGYPVTYEAVRLKRGEPRYMEIRLFPNVNDQGRVLGCLSVTTDITEHKLTEKRIQQVAHHDSLTGLPNRLLLDDRLQQAISLARRNSRAIGLLYLDLDKFKPVNDSLGHAAGDELLVAVAARLRRQLRESDTVARVGGDEFVVIVLDIPGRQVAEMIAAKIAAVLSAPFPIGDPQRPVEIGASIGIALYPEDAVDAQGLLKAADAAMYRAKQAARGLPLTMTHSKDAQPCPP